MMRFDVEFFGGALIGFTLGIMLGVIIGQARADCTGCSESPPPGGSLTITGPTSGAITFAPATPTKMILTIRSDGTIERNGKPLEYVDRTELIDIIGELVDHISKGK